MRCNRFFKGESIRPKYKDNVAWKRKRHEDEEGELR